MLAPLALLSLRDVGDPAMVERELLEVRPELLVQPGIAWSEQWSSATRLAELTWFRAPVEASVRGYRDARVRAAQLGRGEVACPVLEEFLVPLKGYANARVLLSADALPFRPNLGLHLVVSRFSVRDAAVEAAFRWYEQERIPELLAAGGAAGAWSFASESLFFPGRDLSRPIVRAVAVYLDGADFTAPDAPVQAHEEVLFAGTLRSIDAWR